MIYSYNEDTNNLVTASPVRNARKTQQVTTLIKYTFAVLKPELIAHLINATQLQIVIIINSSQMFLLFRSQPGQCIQRKLKFNHLKVYRRL